MPSRPNGRNRPEITGLSLPFVLVTITMDVPAHLPHQIFPVVETAYVRRVQQNPVGILNPIVIDPSRR